MSTTTPAAASFVRTLFPLTEGEASRLVYRLRHSTFLINRAVVLSSERHNNEVIPMQDGTDVPAFQVKIDAPTEVAAAMAYGFVVAISEGVHKLEGAP